MYGTAASSASTIGAMPAWRAALGSSDTTIASITPTPTDDSTSRDRLRRNHWDSREGDPSRRDTGQHLRYGIRLRPTR